MTAPTVAPRYPFEPLERLFPPRWRETVTHDLVQVSPLRQIAEVAQVHERSLLRWRKEGGLPEHQADRVACRLGLHPGLIWPDLWWGAA